MGEIINLNKSYKCVFENPVIDRIDTDIFICKYNSNCMNVNCKDMCCFHGVDIDIENIKRIEKFSTDIEYFTGLKLSEMFKGEYFEDVDFPGGKNTRTSKKNGCIFLNASGKGCIIHSFCINKKIDYHELKPIVSCLFPVTFRNGLLHASQEVLEKSLVCCDGRFNLQVHHPGLCRKFPGVSDSQDSSVGGC